MSTQSAPWRAAARLLRRSGFGAAGPEVDAALRVGAGSYVRQMLAADPAADPGARATPAPGFDPVAALPGNATAAQRQQRSRQRAAQLAELTQWWVQRMAAVHAPFPEKLTFCWHNHFATSATKVRDAGWLLQQNQTLRRLGRGDFRALAQAMLTDAALLDWLDGQKNTVRGANENLSREFLELFALGHGSGYTETDVREGARALTGWRIRRDGSTALVPALHDHGTKTVLGVTGDLDQQGFADAVLARPASARYVVGRTYQQLVCDTPAPAPVLDRLVAAYGPGRDLSAMLTALFTDPGFAAAEGTHITGPVEWLLGAVRALKVPVQTPAVAKRLVAALRALGQVPFAPPNVGGWPAGQAWLSSAAADLRMHAAASLARSGDLTALTGVGASNRRDALAYLLGVAGWSDRSAAALAPALADPVQLVVIALNTPEYLVH